MICYRTVSWSKFCALYIGKKEQMTSDVISWGDKAYALLVFWVESHNATWNSNTGPIRAGNHLGGAILLSFAVECALKASLEAEGSQITRNLMIHSLHKLFGKLSPTARTKTSNVYRTLMDVDKDSRLRTASIDSLADCLKHHDRSFKNWRYNIGQAEKFYPVPMTYSCVSLLTFIYPSKSFSVGSASSTNSEVSGGKVTLSGEHGKT